MVKSIGGCLHEGFACCVNGGKNGFISIVGLQRDTNLPLEDTEKKHFLWAKNKWLIAHEKNTSLVNRGAYAGIYGENWNIKTID